MDSEASQNEPLPDPGPQAQVESGNVEAELPMLLETKVSLSINLGDEHLQTVRPGRESPGQVKRPDKDKEHIQAVRGDQGIITQSNRSNSRRHELIQVVKCDVDHLNQENHADEGKMRVQTMKYERDAGNQSQMEDTQEETMPVRNERLDTVDLKDDVRLMVNSANENDEEAEDNETENHEMEVSFRHEADLPGRYLSCKKNPGHVNFIPVNELKLSHLPSEYQQSVLVDLVQEQAKLAVRLKVNGSSPHRPLIAPGTTNVPYPFSKRQDRGRQRMGSGWILYILKHRDEDKTLCPCSQCQQSGEPRYVWTKVKVATAAHVVYDIIEAKQCTCQLFYDAESTDLTLCPSLCEAIEVDVEPTADTCFISYVIHDSELTDNLDRTIERYKTLCRTIKDKFKSKAVEDPNADISVKTALLYERCSRLRTMYEKCRDKIKEILEGDPRQQWQIYYAGRENIMDNLDGVAVSLLDNIQGGGGKLAEKTLTNINDMYETSCSIIENVGKLKDRCENKNLHDDKAELDKVNYGYTSFQELVVMLERQVSYFKVYMADMDVEEFGTEPAYDPSHPLTIIVSHPHGCSKKITVGKIIEQDSQMHGVTTVYKYDNDTCPGSSGSRVYILGRAGAMMDHAHSGALGTALTGGIQINESSMHQDV